MRHAGCREISFGIESGSPAVLGNMCKRLDLAEAERVVRTTQRVGISTHASYVLGYIGETEDTLKKTISFARRLNTDVAAFFVAVPLPGSRLYADAVEQGLLRPDAAWSDYAPLSKGTPVMQLPGLPADALRRWHRKALRGYYLRPRYVLSRLGRIRHRHEVANIVEGLKILLSLRK
jgi:radical SAM superfamily enzyme YgiQ (UPF0313 family)